MNKINQVMERPIHFFTFEKMSLFMGDKGINDIVEKRNKQRERERQRQSYSARDRMG